MDKPSHDADLCDVGGKPGGTSKKHDIIDKLIIAIRLPVGLFIVCSVLVFVLPCEILALPFRFIYAAITSGRREVEQGLESYPQITRESTIGTFRWMFMSKGTIL
jgi:hypothetical protein